LAPFRRSQTHRLEFGGFALPGIGTAPFEAIQLRALLRRR
jgi:hypothetical protein